MRVQSELIQIKPTSALKSLHAIGVYRLEVTVYALRLLRVKLLEKGSASGGQVLALREPSREVQDLAAIATAPIRRKKTLVTS